MSRRIFRDFEEALTREVRRITFFDQRTTSLQVLQDTFDPITGEIVPMEVEPTFYDSSADAQQIQYPHFFIRLLKTREDRFTGRIIPEWGREVKFPVPTAPAAFEIIANSSDGIIPSLGNTFNTSLFQIRKVIPGYVLRLLNGNNKGSYYVSSVTPGSPSSIVVSNTLVTGLPPLLFDVNTRTVVITQPSDLNTVKVGDNFVDFAHTSFPITAVSINGNNIVIGGSGTPSLTAGATITRTGNVFTASDTSPVNFLILDPNQPILSYGVDQNEEFYVESPAVPIDAYYLVRIDSKQRDTHIDVLNRVWEEFNPPRTGIPIIIRNQNSADQLLTVDVTTGGSNTITISDNSGFNLNDPVFVFNDYMPTKSTDETFQRPFTSTVIGKISTNQLVLADTVPDTFTVANGSKIVSNADYKVHMFHFVDHVTKDIEGAQYWVHEFTFWVQIWVDRLEQPGIQSAVTDIATPVGDLNGNIIIEDP